MSMSKLAIKIILSIIFHLFWYAIIILVLLVFAFNYTLKSLSNTEVMGFSGEYSIKFNKHFVLNIETPKLNGIPIASYVQLHLISLGFGKTMHTSNHLYVASPNFNNGEVFINAKSIEVNLDCEVLKQDDNFTININSSNATGNKINYKDKKNRKFINKFKIRSLDNIRLKTKPTNQSISIKLRTENLYVKDSLEYIEFSPIDLYFNITDNLIKTLININNIKSESYDINMLKINADYSLKRANFSINIPNAKFGSDLTISKISISGAHSAQEISLKSASFNILNGEAFIAPFNIDLENKKFLAPIYFENIDLEKIQQLADNPNLKLEGKLFGNIKLVDSNKMPFMISSGTISNRNQPGKLKYILQTDSKYTKMLTQTLEDFRYKSIHGSLHGTGDVLNIELLIRGYNPNFEQGRTIEFNLNVEENLYNLYRSLTYKDKALDIAKTDGI